MIVKKLQTKFSLERSLQSRSMNDLIICWTQIWVISRINSTIKMEP